MPKPKSRALPDLCLAVKRVREAYGDSQQRFSERVRLSLMTVSKFELGRQVPRDRFVLSGLARAARDAGLEEDAKLFEQHARHSRGPIRILLSRREFELIQETLDLFTKGLPLLRDRTKEVSDADKDRIEEALMLRIAWLKSWVQPLEEHPPSDLQDLSRDTGAEGKAILPSQLVQKKQKAS